ncbi:MAG TPA: pyruvate, water dikinase regulatory protein [Rickettsiales bacterium]|nr:pyruvate, water dikinase regulatory protein [Rickettsiales bacterium]
MKEFHLHLVSDSTGETVSSVARAAIVQFDGVEADEHIWSLVRTPAQLDKVIAGIRANPGVVMYTLVNKELRDRLKAECLKLSLPCIPILAQILSELTSYLGVESSLLPGRQHELDEKYFSRVEAINFTLAHDDGQATWDLQEADIVLVGVSRTSKSPTCVYLAHRGFKAANVPFVGGCPLPADLEGLTKPLVVGLTISPDRLIQIRRSRLQSLKQDEDTNYVDSERVQEEILASRRLYHKNKWPVIDVTRRSVEETAATIIQYFHERMDKQLDGHKAE